MVNQFNAKIMFEAVLWRCHAEDSNLSGCVEGYWFQGDPPAWLVRDAATGQVLAKGTTTTAKGGRACVQRAIAHIKKERKAQKG
jgi:hypothetical protein